MPHEVPSVAARPVSLHSTTPVVQLVCPVWHTSIGVQPRSAAHATQLPTSQTSLVPHDVPSATLPEVAQTGAPVEQSTTPVWHRLEGAQATPDAHVLQEPLSQTWSVPHGVPLATGVPVSLHMGEPVEQSSAPVSHVLVGVHAAPGVHVVQAPLSQTWVPPQAVPSGTFPVSLQMEAPVEQSVAPVWQGLVGLQAVPAVHATQAPARQTSLAPHDVPSGALVPRSVQTGEPVVQSMTPLWQTSVGVQLEPAGHASAGASGGPESKAESVPELESAGASREESRCASDGPSPPPSPIPIDTSVAGASADASSGGPSPLTGSPHPASAPATTAATRAETPARSARRIPV